MPVDLITPADNRLRRVRSACEGEENVRANERGVNSVFLVQLRKNVDWDFRRSIDQEICDGRVVGGTWTWRFERERGGKQNGVKIGWADCPQRVHKKCRKQLAVVSSQFSDARCL